MKKLLITAVIIALMVFFIVPSSLFAFGDDNCGDDKDAEQYTVEGADVYCIDENTEANPDESDYVETGEMVSDVLQEDGEGGDFGPGIDEVNAEAVEIMATTATGGTDEQNQEAVWDIIDDDVDDTPDTPVEEIVKAVMTIADGFVADVNESDTDIDPTLQEYLDEENINEVDVILDEDPLIDGNGEYSDFTATAIMENPLVPGITDQDKTVNWYILNGSYNVSFSETDLVTEYTSTMVDKVDNNDSEDVDGDGQEGSDDHYGEATIPYYFYWWGEGFPEYEEMNVVIGACVDIDEDGMIDKEDGVDLEEFSENMKVVKTVENTEYTPPSEDEYPGDGPYNSPHKVEVVIDDKGNADPEDDEVVINEDTGYPGVETYVPENIDIDYSNAGVVLESEELKEIRTRNEDICSNGHWVGDDYWDCHGHGDHDGWYRDKSSDPCDDGYWTGNSRKHWYWSGWSLKYYWEYKWECNKHKIHSGPAEKYSYEYEPYQRFVLESYSEPCDSAEQIYSAWGDLEVYKSDSETDQPVDGAVYKLTYIKGQTYPPEFTELYATTGTGSSGSGFAEFSHLPWGVWELTEYTAPSGYYIDPDTYTQLIGGSNPAVGSPLTVIDTPGYMQSIEVSPGYWEVDMDNWEFVYITSGSGYFEVDWPNGWEWLSLFIQEGKLRYLPTLNWVDPVFDNEWIPPETHLLFSDYGGEPVISENIEVTNDPIPPEEEQEEEEIVTVAGVTGIGGITVLAFTGFDIINYIIGIVMILFGIIGGIILQRKLIIRKNQ